MLDFIGKIPNPYPDKPPGKIDNFQFISRLVLAREPNSIQMDNGKTATYILAEPYEVSFDVDGKTQFLTIPKGFVTDLVSVPQVARSIVGKVGPHLETAIVHDYLFVAWQLIRDQGARKEDFNFANEVMLAGLKEIKLSFLKYQAIKIAITSWVAKGIYDDPNWILFLELDPVVIADSSGLLDNIGNGQNPIV